MSFYEILNNYLVKPSDKSNVIVIEQGFTD